jgi:cytochrome c553
MTSRAWMLLSVVLGSAVLACGGAATPPAKPAATTPPAATPPAGDAKTAFTGAPAYASSPVTTTAAAAHSAKKIAAPSKSTACLSCHKTGGTATSFVLGGTVFSSDDGKSPLADAEIRFVDDKGAASIAHSDADGNFWLKGPSVTTEIGKAGARKAAASKAMDVPASGNCNECHANMAMFVK